MRIALITGIDRYLESGIDLNGCVRDATNMKALVESKYKFDEIEFRVNEQMRVGELITVLEGEVAKLKTGDEFFWYHSGHGTQVPDIHGDEQDKMDEALVMYDSDWDHMFTDDQLQLVFKNFPAGAYCTFVFDTCFSGGMYRGGRVRNLIPPGKIFAKVVVSQKVRRLAQRVTNLSVMISACQEGQYSEETTFNGKVEGAFTHAIVEEINAHGVGRTCKSLFDEVSAVLAKGGFQQRPNIVGAPQMFDRCFLGIVELATPSNPQNGRWKSFWAWFKSLFS